jgi:hypothetical protein
MWTLIFVVSLWNQQTPVVIVKDFKTKSGCEFMQQTLRKSTYEVRTINTSICVKAE